MTPSDLPALRPEGQAAPAAPKVASGETTPSHETGSRVDAKQAKVPSRRGSRLLHLGRLAGGIAGGMVAEGVRRLASGQIPTTDEMLLTPANARRLADRLSELRGAAMKVGQLLSMEAGEFLPKELTAVLARLREDAHAMPLGQVAEVLNRSWGSSWPEQFRRFSFTPLAAASIGQVHEALTEDGRHLAIKIQYPGVRRSIDSDVDNVATLLGLFRALPSRADLAPLLAEAKRQLHIEADYLREAEHIAAYADRLGTDDGEFALPMAVADLTTPEVLAMSFVPGEPIESLGGASQALRDLVAMRLVRLALREFFDWGLVQTDPNFANYRYHQESDRIGLLDFGATRAYETRRISIFRRLFAAAVRQDRNGLEEAAEAAGYLGADDQQSHREQILALLLDATEPAREAGGFDFARSDLVSRMSQRVMEMRFEQRVWRLPPPDILFLHRKLGGVYLLCSRLRARFDVGALVAPFLDD